MYVYCLVCVTDGRNIQYVRAHVIKYVRYSTDPKVTDITCYTPLMLLKYFLSLLSIYNRGCVCVGYDAGERKIRILKY